MSVHRHTMRLLLVGAGGGAFADAAGIARGQGAAVAIAADIDEAMAHLRAHGAELVMIDVHLDVAAFIAALRRERFLLPVLGCGVAASADRAVAAIRAGARDYVPLPPDAAMIGAALTSAVSLTHKLVGDSPAFQAAYRYASALARLDMPMLLKGPPGSGKQSLARHIHALSGAAGAFVTVSCAGLPADVLASELFGHARGAFDGAVAARAGAFTEAEGGTLYLRDIERLPLALQDRFHHGIGAGALGAGPTRPARIIAGTSRPFEIGPCAPLRMDLARTLATAVVQVPALVERREDIPALARHMITRAAEQRGVGAPALGGDALGRLTQHDWPGNVRELEEVVGRAVALAGQGRIDAACIRYADAQGALADADVPEAMVGVLVGRTVAEVERALILQTLDRQRGNRTSASAILGISVRTMRNKLKSFGEAGFDIAPAGAQQ